MVTLALAVQRLGHEVHVLTKRNGFAWNALQRTPVHTHDAFFRFPFDPRGLVPLWRVVRRVRPEWLVAGMAEEYYPTLLMGRAALFRHASRPLGRVKGWVVARFAARFFVVSEAVRRTLGGGHVLRNPIPKLSLTAAEERSARTRRGIPQDACVVGYAGVFSESKGIFVLCDALEPLMEKYPTLHVLWTGGGIHEAELRARVGERHYFSAWNPVPRLIYAGVDILVVPSLVRESAPRVAAEAQLLGKVVCGSDIGGMHAARRAWRSRQTLRRARDARRPHRRAISQRARAMTRAVSGAH
jgi:glycosyltransferase involved in cell wall biosynthesis